MSENPLVCWTNADLDGRAVLQSLLAKAGYGSLEQAVAAFAVFAHPNTVAAAGGSNLFPVIRGTSAERGSFTALPNGTRAMFDDNTAPTDTFRWAHGIAKSALTDVQFCHVWQNSKDVGAYTNLANVCVLPAFLAKLSDTEERITANLRFRAFELFGYRPADEKTPSRPQGYQALTWAEPLPAVADLESRFRSALSRNAGSRTAKSARELGWRFSNFLPDSSI